MRIAQSRTAEQIEEGIIHPQITPISTDLKNKKTVLIRG
jgi:hypothetical protein